jgi:hypothetical protein
LIPKILAGEVQCTYRTVQLSSLYYVVNNRFLRNPEIHCGIQVYRVEQVNPYTLTDEDAHLAGVESAIQLKLLLRRWYMNDWRHGTLTLFRNWFRTV